jgi:hypothetical protein
VHEYAADREVFQYQDWGPKSSEQTQLYVQRATAAQNEPPSGDYKLAVILTAEQRLTGGCGLTASSSRHHGGRIGYCSH